MQTQPLRFARFLLLWLLFALRAGPALAQMPPHLPAAQGLGVQCPLVLSCPQADDTALHLTYQLRLSQPHGSDQVVVGGSVGASVTVARWVELGMHLTGHYGHSMGRITGPWTVWARLTPPFLAALGSDRIDRGLFLGAEFREQITTGAFDGGGHLLPDAFQMSALADWQLNHLVLRAQLGLDLADAGRYRGAAAGAGAWITALQGKEVRFEVGGEVLAQVAGAGAFQLTAAAGFRVWEQTTGLLTGAAWVRAPDLELDWSVAIYGSASFGRGYRSSRPLSFLDPLNFALLGFRDPLVGADGWIYSDDGQRRLWYYGPPDPQRPGWLRPGAGASGGGLHVGDHVLVNHKREIRSDDGHYTLLGRAACDWCRADPLTQPGPGLAGYGAGCGLVRLLDCGISPAVEGPPAAKTLGITYLPSPKNTARMERGRPPVGVDGHPVELHHQDQQPDGPRVMMTRTEHRLGDNFSKNHQNTGTAPSPVKHGSSWKRETRDTWKREAKRPENQAEGTKKKM